MASMGIAAWAEYPICDPTEHVLGTFCVVDTTSHLGPSAISPAAGGAEVVGNFKGMFEKRWDRGAS